MSKLKPKITQKGESPFINEIQTFPLWNFCREHVKDSILLRQDYARITIRKLPLKIQSGKCESVDNENKKCNELARYSVLYESYEMMERNRSLHRINFSDVTTQAEYNNEIYNRIMKDVFIIMTPHSPQDQLLAGGEMLLLIEIACGADYRIRDILSHDPICKKALDFVSEMRHWDYASLEKRNKKLASYKIQSTRSDSQ